MSIEIDDDPFDDYRDPFEYLSFWELLYVLCLFPPFLPYTLCLGFGVLIAIIIILIELVF